MLRFHPARYYLPAAIAAFVLAAFSGWVGWNWPLAFVPAGLLLLSSALSLFLATRPPIILRERSCTAGQTSFLWPQVQRFQSRPLGSLLFLGFTLRSGQTCRLIYPGEPENSARLVRQIRRLVRAAHRQPAWTDENPVVEPEVTGERPRYRVVRPEDEAEIERLYQRLKSAGHLDHQTSSEERHD